MNHYKISVVKCPVTKIRVTDNTEGISVRNVRGIWVVVPDNLARHAEYVFKIFMDTSPTGNYN